MPKRPRNDEKKGKGNDDGEKRPPKQKPPTRGNRDADPVKIHREYVERHVGGGAAATPEAYRRALEQWHQLPGAVSRPATEIEGTEEERPHEDEDAYQQKRDEDGKGAP